MENLIFPLELIVLHLMKILNNSSSLNLKLRNKSIIKYQNKSNKLPSSILEIKIFQLINQKDINRQIQEWKKNLPELSDKMILHKNRLKIRKNSYYLIYYKSITK